MFSLQTGDTYDTLVTHLRQVRDSGECRYALVDIEVDAKSGAKTNKLGLIAWWVWSRKYHDDSPCLWDQVYRGSGNNRMKVNEGSVDNMMKSVWG